MPNNNPTGINQYTKGRGASSKKNGPKDDPLLNRLYGPAVGRTARIGRAIAKEQVAKYPKKVIKSLARNVVLDKKSGHLKNYTKPAKREAIAAYRMLHPKKSK